MKKPFFSIVIPTRNRATLMRRAVQNALNQTFEDFEVIVSDNFSSDETPQIGRAFEDKRVKYFRSEKALSVGESCEFAMSHAKGEYVSVLSDDDAQAKVFLETFYRLIEKEKAQIVTCPLTPYYAIDTYNYGRDIKKESLIILPYSREITVLNRAEAVNTLFASIRLTGTTEKGKLVKFPQLVNSVYHSSIIKKVKERIPKLMPVTGSDVYTMTLFFNVIDRFCFIDEPLSLYCIWEGSETTGSEGIFRRSPEERKLNYVPLKKTLTSPNYITNVVLRARADWGEDYFPIEPDWSEYFATRLGEIKFMQRSGIDVSEELQEFEQVLSEQKPEVREKIKSANVSSPLRDFFRLKLKKTFIGKMFLQMKYPHIKILNSESEGFANIEECARLIDEDFLRRHASPKEDCKTDNIWI
jgi:glycosyltransferase involved in cell wall biosynthesis